MKCIPTPNSTLVLICGPALPGAAEIITVDTLDPADFGIDHDQLGPTRPGGT